MKKIKLSFVAVLIFMVTLISCTGNENTDSPNGETNNTMVTKSTGNWIEVGAIINGVATVTGDKASLIRNWNNTLLQKSGINGNFTDVSIIEDNGNYQLVFEGSTYKSSFYVKVLSSTTLMAAGDTSCTTSECSEENLGCVVKYDQGPPGYCSPCGNGGSCTKTTSNVTMLSYSLRAS